MGHWKGRLSQKDVYLAAGTLIRFERALVCGSNSATMAPLGWSPRLTTSPFFEVNAAAAHSVRVIYTSPSVAHVRSKLSSYSSLSSPHSVHSAMLSNLILCIALERLRYMKGLMETYASLPLVNDLSQFQPEHANARKSGMIKRAGCWSEIVAPCPHHTFMPGISSGYLLNAFASTSLEK
jgi:hypothetical protein